MTVPSSTDTDTANPASGRNLYPPYFLRDKMLDARVQRILMLTESGKALSIRDLAFEFKLGPSHLQRLFKNQTGVAIGKWLSERRLQAAARLLANSYMSVKEIAYSVGYAHVSSFVRAFERRFARTPVRYRKQRQLKLLRKTQL